MVEAVGRQTLYNINRMHFNRQGIPCSITFTTAIITTPVVLCCILRKITSSRIHASWNQKFRCIRRERNHATELLAGLSFDKNLHLQLPRDLTLGSELTHKHSQIISSKSTMSKVARSQVVLIAWEQCVNRCARLVIYIYIFSRTEFLQQVDLTDCYIHFYTFG